MERTDTGQFSARQVVQLISAIEAESRYYQELLSRLPVALAVVDRAGRIGMSNRMFRELFPGVDPASGARVEDIGAIAHLRPACEESLATGVGCEGELRIAEKPYLFTLACVVDHDLRGEAELLLLVREPLERSVPPDEGWRSLVEDLPGVLWEMDPASMRFVKVSEALVEREGLTAEMWEPGGVFLSSRIREADMPAMKAFYQLAMGGGPARSCDYESRNAAGEMVWLRDTVVMARDNKDQTPRLRGLTVNITESRRRDQFLMQKARVEALERIAGGIIHDCNNLLMIMGGYGEELLHGLPIQDPLRVNVQEILNAADRLTKITGRLSVLTAEGPEGMEEVVVDEIVGLVAGQVRAALPAAVTMERRLGAGRSTTHCHPARLQAALHTVCARAVDAMYKGGTLTVETEIGQIVSAVAGDAESPKPGPAIVIRISDAGLAMRDEDTQTLFEPAAGEPAPLHNFTPLLQIVRRAGGILRVSSGNETGTCFTITLPASAVVMMPDGHSAATVALGTVLVTEDETAIRSLIQKVLERTGYRVIATGSGQEALETAAAHQGAIDLLVTDVKMPGIDGFELANRLHKARPETKILLMSGYTGKASIEPGTVPEGSEFLGKPFTISELLSRVRGLLGGASAATA